MHSDKNGNYALVIKMVIMHLLYYIKNGNYAFIILVHTLINALKGELRVYFD